MERPIYMKPKGKKWAESKLEVESIVGEID